MWIFRESQWTFNTSETGGLGIDFLAASGGEIVLNDPQQQHDLHYSGFGIGYGLGLKIPALKLLKFALPEVALPKIAGHDVGGSVATKNFNSNGYVYMTDAFHGKELSLSDLQGAAVYLDASGVIFGGESATLMLLGINSAMLMMSVVNPAFSRLASNAIRSAPAALVMYGQAAALQAGFSASVMIGSVH